MITVKQHERLIDKITSLSELELDQLLQDIGQHLYKNNLEHLIDNAFQLDDQTEQIEELEEELKNMDEELSNSKEETHALKVQISIAINLLDEMEGEEFGEEWGRKQVSKIKEALQ